MFRPMLGRSVPAQSQRLLSKFTACVTRDQTLPAPTTSTRFLASSSRPSVVFPAVRCYATATGATKKTTTKAKTTTKKATKPKTTTTTKAKATKKKPAKKPAKKPIKKVAKKKPAAKKRVVKKVKKQPTAIQAKRAKVTQLRKVALLNAPKSLPASGFMVFSDQNLSTRTAGQAASAFQKAAGAQWSSMSDGEKDRFASIAAQNKAANEKTYKAWVQQHTPWEIYIANNARRHLNRISKEPKPAGETRKLVGAATRMIQDPRKLARVSTPFIAYSRERWSSGDFKGVPPSTAAKTIGTEWTALSATEKQRFHDVYKEETTKYAEDYERVYGRPKTTTTKRTKATATATAA